MLRGGAETIIPLFCGGDHTIPKLVYPTSHYFGELVPGLSTQQARAGGGLSILPTRTSNLGLNLRWIEDRPSGGVTINDLPPYFSGWARLVGWLLKQSLCMLVHGLFSVSVLHCQYRSRAKYGEEVLVRYVASGVLPLLMFDAE